MEKVLFIMLAAGAITLLILLIKMSAEIDNNSEQIGKLKKELSILKDGNNTGS